MALVFEAHGSKIALETTFSNLVTLLVKLTESVPIQLRAVFPIVFSDIF